MKMKDCGWVLCCTIWDIYSHDNSYGYLDSDSTILRTAKVFKTRAEARGYKHECDRVLKVSLTKDGKPKMIIGKG